MSREKVISALNKKAQEAEDLAKATEKSYLKDGIDVKTFTKNFIQQRSQYHQYQIIKVKVNQSWLIKYFK